MPWGFTSADTTLPGADGPGADRPQRHEAWPLRGHKAAPQEPPPTRPGYSSFSSSRAAFSMNCHNAFPPEESHRTMALARPCAEGGKATRATCSPDQPPLGAASGSPGSRAPDSEHLCPPTGRGHLRQCPCRPGSCSPSARALAPVPRLQVPRVGQRRGVIGPTKHAGQKGRGRAAASPTCRPWPRGPGLCRLTGPRREQP